MKRKNNLYDNMYKLENIETVFNEICKNTKNKKRVEKYKEFKCANIYDVYNTLKNRAYKPGKLNVFEIYEPKKRRIVSQEMKDKLINHLVARFILYPSSMPCLIDANVASRKHMGTNKGIELANKYRKICNIKYKKYYVLKCDISKFFASIDNDKLKEKIRKRIKDKDALEIVFRIIDAEEYGLSIRMHDKSSISYILLK